MGDFALMILALLALILVNGFFSGSEIAVISVSKGRIDALAKEGRRAAQRVKELRADPERFLASVQVGVTLMGTLAGVIGGYLATLHIAPFLDRAGMGRWISPQVVAAGLVSAGIVYVSLILGELVPKALALRFADTLAMATAPILSLVARLSHAGVAFLTLSTRAVLRLFGVKEMGYRTFVSEEEILHLVRAGREQGVLDQTEAELIHSVFEFTETPVKRVMIPRHNIFAVDADTPPGEAERLMIESGFSRIPVYEGSLDSVVGVVFAKDALRLLEKRQPVVLRKILHPVHLVPETKKVGVLLKELQKRRTHIALVIDEHGSLSGLVTLEDLIEEIVGDIQDEYDWEERPVERQRDGSLVVEGTVSAADLREKYQVPIPESSEFETVAGFMLDVLGSVPKGGEVVTVGGYRLTIVDVEKTRISKVKVERTPVPATPSPKRYLR
jgi:putative hemolysin